MSGSRIKTIVLATLALINALFLMVIIIDAVADARDEREALENACAILRAGGVTIYPDNVRAASAIRPMRTARAIEVEEAIARAVLGPVAMTDYGVIYVYESPEWGTAEFAFAGEFEIRVNAGAVTNESGSLRTVQVLIREMGLEAMEFSVYLGSDGDMVTAVVAHRDGSIFNCTIDFFFSDGSLQTVRGRYVAGIVPAEDSAFTSPVGTALLGFLAAVRDEEREYIVATRIFNVEAGYLHRVVGILGEGVLDPAWRITTDAGLYFVVDATGEVRAGG